MKKGSGQAEAAKVAERPPGEVEQLAAKGAVKEKEFTEQMEMPPAPANVKEALEEEVKKTDPGFIKGEKVEVPCEMPGITAEVEGNEAYLSLGPASVGGEVKAGDYSSIYAGVEAGSAWLGVANYAEISPSFEPKRMEPGLKPEAPAGKMEAYSPTLAVEAAVSENASVYAGYTPKTGEGEMVFEYSPARGLDAVSAGVIATKEGLYAMDLRAELGNYNMRATFIPEENTVMLNISKTF
jgi:hypothetical protein